MRAMADSVVCAMAANGKTLAKPAAPTPETKARRLTISSFYIQ
jgi:hypothetical protein